MSLESLLKPVKAVDEELLRKYTKFVKKRELKGKSRYSLCYLGIAASFIGGSTFALNIPEQPVLYGIYTILYGCIIGSDIVRTKDYSEGGNNLETKVMVMEDPDTILLKNISKYLRLPFFLSAVGFGIKSLVELYQGLVHQDSETLSQSLTGFVTATGFFGISSSMYLKDADPNVLKKNPLWKRAYNWAKEKVSSYLPSPSPEPVPVQAYSALEEITAE